MRSQAPLLVLVAVLACLPLAVVFGPGALDLHTAFLGVPHEDHHGTQWFFWYIARTVAQGELPFHTDLFFYPWGKEIYLHTGANFLDALAAAPFVLTLGSVAGYNLFLFVGLIASSLAFRYFLVDRGVEPAAALLGAALLPVTPYVLHESMQGRPTQAILILPVLFLLFLYRCGEDPRWRNPLLAGLFLALTGYQYWYYGMFGAAIAVGLLAWWLARPPGEGARLEVLARLSLALVVALLLVAPLALPMLLASLDGGESIPGRLAVEQWSLSSTPARIQGGHAVGIFTWQVLGGQSGYLSESASGIEQFDPRYNWVPWAIIPMALLALRRPRPQAAGPSLSMLLVVCLLAAGPAFVLYSLAIPNPPYIWLTKALVPLQRLWWPGRAFAFGTLLILLLGTLGLSRLRGRWLLSAVGLTSLAWIAQLLLSGLAPMPTWDGRIPAPWRCLAHGPPGALLELPAGETDMELYYQTHHGRPLFGGMIENNPSFVPAERYALISENTWLQAVMEISSKERDSQAAWTEDDRARIGALGYRFVLLQRRDPAETTGFARTVHRTRQRNLNDQMEELLGPAVWSQGGYSIHTPWGGGSPCPDMATEARPVGEVTPTGRHVGLERLRPLRRISLTARGGGGS